MPSSREVDGNVSPKADASKLQSHGGPGDASPDSRCPICLDKFNNMSHLDRCLHRFCFSCIQKWANIKAECPLCKQHFQSIFHSVQAEDGFKEYVVRPTMNESFAEEQSMREIEDQEIISIRRALAHSGSRVRNIRYGGHSLNISVEFFIQNLAREPDVPSSALDVSQAPWDDETPGPSYSTSEQATTVMSTTVNITEGSDEESSSREVAQENKGMDNAGNVQSRALPSDECVIVGNVKLLTERTPELVELPSSSLCEVKTEDNKKRLLKLSNSIESSRSSKRWAQGRDNYARVSCSSGYNMQTFSARRDTRRGKRKHKTCHLAMEATNEGTHGFKEKEEHIHTTNSSQGRHTGSCKNDLVVSSCSESRQKWRRKASSPSVEIRTLAATPQFPLASQTPTTSATASPSTSV